MLIKQGPDKIDWTDYTWNPISGKCQHNCPYCYMHGFWRRRPETAINQLKEKYLKDKFPKKPSKIFVGSSTDMWGDWVSSAWICRVLEIAITNPRHIFQFLTKNPNSYSGWALPVNGWFGTTFDGTDKTIENIPKLIDSVGDHTIYVSFEPLIGDPYVAIPDIRYLSWIIIGADSSKGAKKPPKAWADHLIETARHYDIPVFVKDNYGYPEKIKEFPKSTYE